jgi:hypothetical protein
MTRMSALRTVVLLSFCSTVALPQVTTKPGTFALKVLRTRCHDVSKAGDQQVFAAIDALAKDSTLAASEALAILNGFYLGEQPSLRVYGAMQHRDKKLMIALLKKHAASRSVIPAPCTDVVMEPKMRELAYEYVIGSLD